MTSIATVKAAPNEFGRSLLPNYSCITLTVIFGGFLNF